MKHGKVLCVALVAIGLGFVASSTGLAGVNPSGSTYDNGTGYYIGDFSVGTLRIDAASQLSRTYCYIGNNSGSTGTATVTDAGSLWTITNYFSVGYYGNGTLNIQAHGQVNCNWCSIGDSSGSTGTATVTGAGSTWANTGELAVGYHGNGTLNILAGGQVSSSSGTLAGYVGSTGTATVNGAGSKWTCSGMVIGEDGTGTLNVQAGGQIINTSATLGYDSGYTGSATITGNGSTWTNNGDLYVGNSGSGILRVEAKGQVTNYRGYIGNSPVSTGTATVTGSGSKWTTSRELYVGYSGSGTLNIQDGGQVSSGDSVSNYNSYIGYNAGSTGTVAITGAGSKWTSNGCLYVGNNGSGKLTVSDGGLVTTPSLMASLSDLSGNGTITVSKSAVLDAALVFDATHGLTQTLAFGTGGTLGLTVDSSGTLGVGYKGTGTLRIAQGVTVTSAYSYLGYRTGSNGTATVTGAGSKWTDHNFYVGYNGNGTLNIQASGQVNGLWNYLGYGSGATGTATITGPGSNWINVYSSYYGPPDDPDPAYLYVGYYGNGKLTVADGGKFVADWVNVYNTQSAIRLNVSGNGMIVLGSPRFNGSVANNGTVSLYANAFLAKGTYTPISEYSGRAMTWSGTGSYKAVGGAWSGSAHTFTVTDPTTATAGVLTGVSSGQRMVITDSGSNKHAGVSFGSVTGSPTFSASPMSSIELAALAQTSGFAGSVLSGWDYNTSLTGTEVMLSFDIGTGAGDVAVWHYSGGAWAPFTGDMQTYDSNGILSFTATDFAGGYAVTATPEPATMAMLTIGALAMLRRRRTPSTQTTR